MKLTDLRIHLQQPLEEEIVSGCAPAPPPADEPLLLIKFDEHPDAKLAAEIDEWARRQIAASMMLPPEHFKVKSVEVVDGVADVDINVHLHDPVQKFTLKITPPPGAFDDEP